MVHLKYPILVIWCCHKHIKQLPPSRLKFDTKLRKVFPNNLAAYGLCRAVLTNLLGDVFLSFLPDLSLDEAI